MKIQHTNLLSLWVLTLGWALTCTGTAQAQPQQYIPHRLLGLIHTPEVHRELKLTHGQVDQLEDLFDQIDGQWWRSRNLKPDENAVVILKLEETVNDWFRSNCTAVQQQRFQQQLFQQHLNSQQQNAACPEHNLDEMVMSHGDQLWQEMANSERLHLLDSQYDSLDQAREEQAVQ